MYVRTLIGNHNRCSKALCVSTRQIYRLIENGDLPYKRIGKRGKRIPYEALVEFATSGWSVIPKTDTSSLSNGRRIRTQQALSDAEALDALLNSRRRKNNSRNG